MSEAMAVVFAIFWVVMAIFWCIVPFVILKISRKLDTLIEIQRMRR